MLGQPPTTSPQAIQAVEGEESKECAKAGGTRGAEVPRGRAEQEMVTTMAGFNGLVEEKICRKPMDFPMKSARPTR